MADNHQPQVVDLTEKSSNSGKTKPWIGRDVSSIITVDDISKVILLKAMTNAPSNINIESILNSIEKSTKFESHRLDFSSPSIIFEALLFTKQGKYIRYIANGEWVRISIDNGDLAFKRHRKIF